MSKNCQEVNQIIAIEQARCSSPFSLSLSLSHGLEYGAQSGAMANAERMPCLILDETAKSRLRLVYGRPLVLGLGCSGPGRLLQSKQHSGFGGCRCNARMLTGHRDKPDAEFPFP